MPIPTNTFQRLLTTGINKYNILLFKQCYVSHFSHVFRFCFSQSPALQQLTSLYVSRSKTIWRDADILPWLERNVNIVLDRVDEKDPIVNEYQTKRAQRYNKIKKMFSISSEN